MIANNRLAKLEAQAKALVAPDARVALWLAGLEGSLVEFHSFALPADVGTFTREQRAKIADVVTHFGNATWEGYGVVDVTDCRAAAQMFADAKWPEITTTFDVEVTPADAMRINAMIPAAFRPSSLGNMAKASRTTRDRIQQFERSLA